jgi:hypothetical protein
LEGIHLTVALYNTRVTEFVHCWPLLYVKNDVTRNSKMLKDKQAKEITGLASSMNRENA